MERNISKAAPYKDYGDYSSDEKVPKNLNEAYFLYIIAAIGLLFNSVIIGCIVTCKPLRRMTSAFIVHGCALDSIKSIYCLPFATSLMRNEAPGFCSFLGGSYVIVVTASGFNMVAMICCEAYIFSGQNIGREGKGTFCCITFGLLMIYIGSIIIHLGPTIIAGNFNYNTMIGNCIFEYGTIKSYVVHAMWIAIMTLAMAGAIYYLFFFYKHVQANSTHRLASLARVSIALSRGNTGNNGNIQKVVRDSLSRARVLMTIIILFILCWYPLFILTLVDPHYKIPPKIYKLLTFIASSNSAINPLVFLIFDRHINVFRQLQCCTRLQCFHGDEECDGGDERDVPLVASGGTVSLPGTPKTPKWSGGRKHSFPMATVYQRVGCRLCQEGESHSNTQCSGAVGQSSLVRDTSICELHSSGV